MRSNYKNELIKEIHKKLGKRKLVWFGTRGADARALLQLDNFSEIFSLIAPLDALALKQEMCMETLTGRRVDLDNYTIDNDKSPEAMLLHQRLYESLAETACLASYRPANFLSSICFPRGATVEYLGLFHEIQAPFEHKPWVETELKKLDIRTVPWKYLGEEDRRLLEEIIENSSCVVRTNRSDGGVGLTLVHEISQIREAWFVGSKDQFFGVAPYMLPNIPLNVNACVLNAVDVDGRNFVSLHSPSLQLIGVPEFTRRHFGYCGNDFARLNEIIPPEKLDELESAVIKAGKWLGSKGYLGAFGVDAMLYEDDIYITEINPRFQGSSDVSSFIDLDMDRPDMFLEHVAAFLGITLTPPSVKLRDLAKDQTRIAHVVCHNIEPQPRQRNAQYIEEADGERYMLLPRQGVTVEPESILFRAVIQDAVTRDGGQVLEPYLSRLHTLGNDLFT